MAELKFTQGGWKVGESLDKWGNETPIYGEDHYELARVFIHNGEQFANAHLIASAPELYNALRTIVESLNNGDTQRAFNVADGIGIDALNKAEGK